jgi:hypothetical protein
MNENENNWLGKELPIGAITSKNLSRLERAKSFLQFYVDDAESADEIRIFRFQNLSNPMIQKHINSLEAIEWLANEMQPNVSLTEIVKWDANYVIETGTDEVENPEQAEREAKLWLLEFAEFVREILGTEMPSRKYPVLTSRPRRYFFPE